MASFTEAANALGKSDPGCDPRRALLSRVAASASFAKAPRLRKLLLYLGESALTTPQLALTEQQVGVAVFDRPPGYDTSADTIVRVQASEIRKRLKYYFAGEGFDQPIIMDLPRGSYVPVFYYRADQGIEGVRTEVAAVQDVGKSASPEALAPGRGKLPPPAELGRVSPARAPSSLVSWLLLLLSASLLLCAGLAYQNFQLRSERISTPPSNHLANVLPGKCLSTSAGKGWTNVSFPVQTRIFTASFDATAGVASRVNDVIGISEEAQNLISKYSIIVAFSETGYILARSGNHYTAVNAVRYTASTPYHFRLVIDVPAHTYSVYVTPPGGTELTIGTNFGFRSEANDVKSLNSLGGQVDSSSGAITFCNLAVS